jgi:endo-1,4-beta-D-glucanase Y
MAMGLLMAHYQWGSGGKINYLAEATGLINNISDSLVERPANVLKPAATWGGSNLLDPCYYDSIYYPLWTKLTGDPCWTKLDEHYRSLVTYFINQYGTGLLPDWCKADGTDAGISGKPYFYSWDAQQISTKWAIHYAWYGTSKTDVFFNAAKKFAAWVKKQANGNLSSLMDSYTLDGKPCGTYSQEPGVVGAMGLSGTVASEYQSLVNDAYTYLLTLDSGADYNYAMSYWKVVQSLIYSGNFVNFTDLDSK